MNIQNQVDYLLKEVATSWEDIVAVFSEDKKDEQENQVMIAAASCVKLVGLFEAALGGLMALNGAFSTVTRGVSMRSLFNLTVGTGAYVFGHEVFKASQNVINMFKDPDRAQAEMTGSALVGAVILNVPGASKAMSYLPTSAQSYLPGNWKIKSNSSSPMDRAFVSKVVKGTYGDNLYLRIFDYIAQKNLKANISKKV